MQPNEVVKKFIIERGNSIRIFLFKYTLISKFQQTRQYEQVDSKSNILYNDRISLVKKKMVINLYSCDSEI